MSLKQGIIEKSEALHNTKILEMLRNMKQDELLRTINRTAKDGLTLIANDTKVCVFNILAVGSDQYQRHMTALKSNLMEINNESYWLQNTGFN
jgi:hypothetical protein